MYEAQGMTMNSNAMTSTYMQCRGINSPSLFSPISHSNYKLRVRPINGLKIKRFPSRNDVNFGHFLSGHSLQRWAPLYKKEAFFKKISAKAEANTPSPSGPEKNPLKFFDCKVDGACAQKLRIGLYFAVWWSLNVVFNIYNKKVLNVYPFPWLTSTLSLAAGSAIMLLSWALKIVEPPQVDCDFWKSLAPVAIAHTIGHVAATVSMSKVAVSFTHIIKSAEPAFSVLIQRLVFGERFPCMVYLSLLPIIGGCGLAAVTELQFNMIGLSPAIVYHCFHAILNYFGYAKMAHLGCKLMDLLLGVKGQCRCWWTGFAGAMISNIAFVFRNIFSKRGMSSNSKMGKLHVGGMNYYACLSMMSFAFLTPFALAIEGPKAWIVGWKATNLVYGNQLLWWMVAQSVFYHLYNQVSYMSLDEISPLTFSIGNTIKRVTVIVSSILIFHTKILPINVIGAALAIFGTLLYSQIKQ